VSPTTPAGGTAATPVKHTCRPDLWTPLFVVLTAVLGAWSLSLIAAHDAADL